MDDYIVPQLGKNTTPIWSRRLRKAVSRIKQHHGTSDTITAPVQTRTELVLSCSESSDED